MDPFKWITKKDADKRLKSHSISLALNSDYAEYSHQMKKGNLVADA